MKCWQCGEVLGVHEEVHDGLCVECAQHDNREPPEDLEGLYIERQIDFDLDRKAGIGA